MSKAINIVSEWNGGVSLTIFRNGNKFCANANNQNSCISVTFGLDDAIHANNQLSEWIAEMIEETTEED